MEDWNIFFRKGREDSDKKEEQLAQERDQVEVKLEDWKIFLSVELSQELQTASQAIRL